MADGTIRSNAVTVTPPSEQRSWLSKGLKRQTVYERLGKACARATNLSLYLAKEEED